MFRTGTSQFISERCPYASPRPVSLAPQWIWLFPLSSSNRPAYPQTSMPPRSWLGPSNYISILFLYIPIFFCTLGQFPCAHTLDLGGGLPPLKSQSIMVEWIVTVTIKRCSIFEAKQHLNSAWIGERWGPMPAALNVNLVALRGCCVATHFWVPTHLLKMSSVNNEALDGSMYSEMFTLIPGLYTLPFNCKQSLKWLTNKNVLIC